MVEWNGIVKDAIKQGFLWQKWRLLTSKCSEFEQSWRRQADSGTHHGSWSPLRKERGGIL